jgi:NADPH:quinone reductase-like Zn-dependent oxidoreductase
VTAGDVVLHNLPGVMYWRPIRRLLGIPPKKVVPGHEFAGVIEAVGPSVGRFRVGDEVFGTTTGLTTGTNAEYVCVPEAWETGVVEHKPVNLTYAQAAAVPVGGMTARYLLMQAGIRPDEHVLIYGASGSVGTYAVQLAKHSGAYVTAVCSARNTALVASLGADRVLDYRTDEFAKTDENYAVVFDAVGKLPSEDRKRLLRADGRWVSVGSRTSESTDALAHLRDLIEADKLHPVIDRSYTLEQIDAAYQHVRAGHKSGNVVIDIASG